MNRLLLFAESSQNGIGYGIALAFILGFMEFFKSAMFALFWGLSYR